MTPRSHATWTSIDSASSIEPRPSGYHGRLADFASLPSGIVDLAALVIGVAYVVGFIVSFVVYWVLAKRAVQQA